MLGDGTLFAERDGVEATWALMTPILEAWGRRSTARISQTTRRAPGVRRPATRCSRRNGGANGFVSFRGRSAVSARLSVVEFLIAVKDDRHPFH